MQNIEKYIETLMEQKGTTGMTQEEKTALKAELMQMLLDRIDRAAIYALPEDKAVELTAKLDDPNFGSEQMTEFMKEAGVDFQQVALKTMLQFQTFYLNGAPQNERTAEQQ